MSELNPEPQVPWSLLAIINVITLSVIVLGSMYKISQLNSGGQAVAQAMGGTPAYQLVDDPLVKRYINVVEEISIASGVPVPEIYVMNNEQGINAFAAGYEIDHAVVAVTRGCLEKLNRDELQGVVAHEFSHILNGDMRLNIKLIGTLHGILIIGILGYQLLRIRWSSGRSSKGSGQIALVMYSIAIALVVIGYSGFFIGRLIKAAVSREREYLADASAVQFTRNPLGIGGALRKIQENAFGSFLQSKNAEEMSHMFFESGVNISFLSSMLATHPPLPDRIGKIDPKLLDPNFKLPEGNGMIDSKPEEETKSKIKNPSDVIGETMFQDIFVAQAMLESFQRQKLDLNFDAEKAKLFIYCVLAIENKTAIQKSDYIKNASEENLKFVGEVISKLTKAERVAGVEMALSTIKSFPQSEKDNIRNDLIAIALDDQKVDHFEMCILITVEQALRPESHYVKNHNRSLMQLKKQIQIVLTYISRLSKNPSLAYNWGHRELFMDDGKPVDPQFMLLKRILDAFVDIRFLKDELKEKLVNALHLVIAHDEEFKEDELEIFKCVLKALGVPAPPSLAQLMT